MAMTETYQDNDNQVWLLVPNDGHDINEFMCNICEGPLAQHYVTFDNQSGGCVGLHDEIGACMCEGFCKAD